MRAKICSFLLQHRQSVKRYAFHHRLKSHKNGDYQLVSQRCEEKVFENVALANANHAQQYKSAVIFPIVFREGVINSTLGYAFKIVEAPPA